MPKFNTLVAISPLGLLYGSAGGFLSPENLVGRSQTKFPPDAATLAGLIFNANREQAIVDHKTLNENLVVAGPFWAKQDDPKTFYVPIPWHRVIAKDDADEWSLIPNSGHNAQTSKDWCLNQYHWQRQDEDVKPFYAWQSIDAWDSSLEEVRHRKAIASVPWQHAPFLHPKLKDDERHVEQGGLFLENAMQMQEDACLVYLVNLDTSINDGWYRFGGEGHLVELTCHKLADNHKINRLLKQPIQHAFALITPGVWGSNKYSYRYPKHTDFPKKDLKMLTDKPTYYRYRIGQRRSEDPSSPEGDRSTTTGRLSRGRYAVPAGSVYVFRQPLNMTWWDFPDAWFPKEGFPLKQLGCGLCLPIEIQGVPECTEKLTA